MVHSISSSLFLLSFSDGDAIYPERNPLVSFFFQHWPISATRADTYKEANTYCLRSDLLRLAEREGGFEPGAAGLWTIHLRLWVSIINSIGGHVMAGRIEVDCQK